MPMSEIPPDPGYCGDPRRGASMGRVSHEGDGGPNKRFYLQRVRINSGGYDSGGAYWGIGAPLWRYESECGSADGFLRSRDREAAKGAIRAIHVGARFFR